MKSLIDLPSELLISIIDNLDQRDIASVVRACRSLQRLALPLLYESIELEWIHNRPHPRIASLLLTLLNRQELASCVQSIVFSGNPPRGSKTIRKHTKRNRNGSASVWCGEKDGFSTVSTSIATKLQELEPWFYRKCVQDLRAGEVDVFVALILARTENLRVLRLSSEFQCDTSYIGDILRRAITPNNQFHGFKALQRVEYGDDIKHFLDMESISIDENQLWPLLMFPSLQTLRAVVPNKDGFGAYDSSALHSSLRSLTLCYYKSDNTSLLKLFSSTQNLTSLDLNLAYDHDDLLPDPLFLESAIFVNALSQIAASLKHLRLSTTFYSVCCDPEWTTDDLSGGGYGASAHSIKFLNNLESLDIPVVGLLGWRTTQKPEIPGMSSLLPSKLRHLVLTDEAVTFFDYEWDDNSLLGQLVPYFEDTKNSLHMNLESFTLKIPLTDECWFQDTEEVLRARCEDNGIKCRIQR